MNNGLAEALVQLSHRVNHVFADVSRERDLTPQQAQLLCILIQGPLGMGELGRMLNLEKSSLSGLVDRAEKRGLVARVRDGVDRRTCTIELTGEGRKQAHGAHDGVVERVDTLLAEVEGGHREALSEALAKILSR